MKWRTAHNRRRGHERRHWHGYGMFCGQHGRMYPTVASDGSRTFRCERCGLTRVSSILNGYEVFESGSHWAGGDLVDREYLREITDAYLKLLPDVDVMEIRNDAWNFDGWSHSRERFVRNRDTQP